MKRLILATTTLAASSQIQNIQGITIQVKPPKQMELKLTDETYYFAEHEAGKGLLATAMRMDTCPRSNQMQSIWKSELTVARISEKQQLIYVQTPYTEYWDGTCAGEAVRIHLNLKTGWNKITHGKSGLVKTVSAVQSEH